MTQPGENGALRSGPWLPGLAILMLLVPSGIARAVPGSGPAPVPVPAAATVAAASAEPGLAAASFGMPDGFVVELFAAEPDVANPVAFSIDEQGRVFVCETFRQGKGVTDNRGHDREWTEADLAAQTVDDRRAYHLRLLGEAAAEYERADDRIRMLVDTDGDGRADRSEVFAEGFNGLIEGTAAGILARRSDVYLTCIPSLYRLRDGNGDGRADASPEERQVLSTGYGVRVAFRGHDLHGLTLGPDGRIYFTIGDRGYRLEHDGLVDHDPGTGAVFRCDPDGRNLEVVARGLRNPQELAFDDLGNLFTVDNNSDAGDMARLVHLTPGSESGWNMAYQYLADRGPWHREKIWHTECDGQPAWCLPPVAHVSSGPSGLVAYPGTGLTPHFDGRFLLADFRGGAAVSAVRSFRLRPKAGSFEPFDEEETFRGVLATDVEIGPDGAVWVSDWVESWEGAGKGRLWRFLPRDRDQRAVDEVRDLLASDWTTFETGRLDDLLDHANRRLRLEAQWELARRGDSDTLALTLADASRPLLARVHAVQGLGQIARSSTDAPGRPMAADETAEPLLAALGDPAWEVRLVAARAVGDVNPDAARRHEAQTALARSLTDEHPHVVVAAASSLGHLGCRKGDAADMVPALVTLAAGRATSDRTIRHAAVMGLAGAATPAELIGLVTHDSQAVRLAACLAMRHLRDERIAMFLDDAADAIAIEAARAIHDLPLEGCLPALAARAGSGPADDAFLRRAVSAAEQIGSAAELIRVIGRSDASTEARGEAIAAIHAWADPRRVNRVTGTWIPAASPRPPAIARDALDGSLESLLTQNPPLDASLRSCLLAAAASLGIEKVVPLLRDCATQATNPAAVRASAIDALLASGDESVGGLADALVGDASPLVRMAARRARAASRPTAAIVPDLVAACGGGDLDERQQAVGLLARMSDPAATAAVEALDDRLRDGTLDPSIALEVGEAVALRLAAASESATPAANTAASDPLSSWSEVLAGGSVARGRDVFRGKAEVSCVRCHQAEGTGGDVGPTLDGIARLRDTRHLLESIVAPNAKVADGFATTVILTEKGLAETGIVVAEDEACVTLKTADGTLRRVAVDSIDERTSGPSAMPGDLAGRLTRREMRDLIAWLQSLK